MEANKISYFKILALPGFVWVIWCQIVPQIVCEKEVPRVLPFVRGGLRWGRVLDLCAS